MSTERFSTHFGTDRAFSAVRFLMVTGLCLILLNITPGDVPASDGADSGSGWSIETSEPVGDMLSRGSGSQATGTNEDDDVEVEWNLTQHTESSMWKMYEDEEIIVYNAKDQWLRGLDILDYRNGTTETDKLYQMKGSGLQMKKVMCEDLDRDNDDDLLIYGISQKTNRHILTMLESDGDWSDPDITIINSAADSAGNNTVGFDHIQVIDVNENHNRGVVCVDSKDKVHTYGYVKSGQFTETTDDCDGENIYITTTGDVNGDGYTDLVLGTKNGSDEHHIYVYSQQGKAPKMMKLDIERDDKWAHLACGDVNGDGIDEIIAVENLDSQRIFIYYHDRLLRMKETLLLQGNKGDNGGGALFDSSRYWNRLIAGDVDGDGMDELFGVQNWHKHLVVFEMDGDEWKKTRVDKSGSKWKWLGLMDLDGDTIDDLVVYRGSDFIGYHRNLYGYFRAADVWTPGSSAFSKFDERWIALGDIDHDNLFLYQKKAKRSNFIESPPISIVTVPPYEAGVNYATLDIRYVKGGKDSTSVSVRTSFSHATTLGVSGKVELGPPLMKFRGEAGVSWTTARRDIREWTDSRSVTLSLEQKFDSVTRDSVIFAETRYSVIIYEIWKGGSPLVIDGKTQLKVVYLPIEDNTSLVLRPVDEYFDQVYNRTYGRDQYPAAMAALEDVTEHRKGDVLSYLGNDPFADTISHTAFFDRDYVDGYHESGFTFSQVHYGQKDISRTDVESATKDTYWSVGVECNAGVGRAELTVSGSTKVTMDLFTTRNDSTASSETLRVTQSFSKLDDIHDPAYQYEWTTRGFFPNRDDSPLKDTLIIAHSVDNVGPGFFRYRTATECDGALASEYGPEDNITISVGVKDPRVRQSTIARVYALVHEPYEPSHHIADREGLPEGNVYLVDSRNVTKYRVELEAGESEGYKGFWTATFPISDLAETFGDVTGSYALSLELVDTRKRSTFVLDEEYVTVFDKASGVAIFTNATSHSPIQMDFTEEADTFLWVLPDQPVRNETVIVERLSKNPELTYGAYETDQMTAVKFVRAMGSRGISSAGLSVNVSLYYTLDEAAGLQPGSLALCKWNGLIGRWEPMEGGLGWDGRAGYHAWGLTGSFGTFGLFGNSLPLADAGPDAWVWEGRAARFDGSGSTDPDGKVVRYEWDLDYDGRTFDPDWWCGENPASWPEVTWYDNGAYAAVLRVTDDDGAVAYAHTTLVVKNLAPQPEISGPAVLDVGWYAEFTGSARDPANTCLNGGVNDTFTFHWEFGDGIRLTGEKVRHVYWSEGRYRVTLMVTDDDGGAAEETFDVTVRRRCVSLGDPSDTVRYSDAARVRIPLVDEEDLPLRFQTGAPKVVHLDLFIDGEWVEVGSDTLDDSLDKDCEALVKLCIPAKGVDPVIDLTEGRYDMQVRARFDGDAYYNGTVSYGTLTVLRERTLLSDPSFSMVITDSKDVTVTLADDEGLGLLQRGSGYPVTLEYTTLGGEGTWIALDTRTLTSGTQVTFHVENPAEHFDLISGDYFLRVRFAGDDRYEGTVTTGYLTLEKEKVVPVLDDFTCTYTDPVTVRLEIRDNDGEPLVHREGEPKTFILEAQVGEEYHELDRQTLMKHPATWVDFTFSIPEGGFDELPEGGFDEPAGTYRVRARFDGDERYRAAQTSAAMRLEREHTVLSVPSGSVVFSDSAEVTVRMEDDDGGGVLHQKDEPKYVRLSVLTAACDWVLLDNVSLLDGAVTFDVRAPWGTFAGAPGNYTLRAEWCGDGRYLGASRNGTLTVLPETTVLSDPDNALLLEDRVVIGATLADDDGSPLLFQGERPKRVALQLETRATEWRNLSWDVLVSPCDTATEVELVFDRDLLEFMELAEAYHLRLGFAGDDWYEGDVSLPFTLDASYISRLNWASGALQELIDHPDTGDQTDGKLANAGRDLGRAMAEALGEKPPSTAIWASFDRVVQADSELAKAMVHPHGVRNLTLRYDGTAGNITVYVYDGVTLLRVYEGVGNGDGVFIDDTRYLDGTHLHKDKLGQVTTVVWYGGASGQKLGEQDIDTSGMKDIAVDDTYGDFTVSQVSYAGNDTSFVRAVLARAVRDRAATVIVAAEGVAGSGDADIVRAHSEYGAGLAYLEAGDLPNAVRRLQDACEYAGEAVRPD